MSSNRGNRKRSFPIQTDGRNEWSPLELNRLTFVAASSCWFRHVFSLGSEYWVTGKSACSGRTLGSCGMSAGGQAEAGLFSYRVEVGVTPDLKVLCKEECKGRITIPRNIMDFLNNDATRTGDLYGLRKTISAFGGIYEGHITGLASTRVRIADTGKHMADIWLDSKSKYIIPIVAEPRDESIIYQDILKCWEDAKQLEPKREVALEFLDEWAGTFHVGVIRECRSDGYITIVKDPDEEKSIQKEGGAEGMPEKKYMFHYSSLCLLPYGFCAAMDSAARTGGGKLRHHLKACYGGIDALENWIPAPLDRLPHNQRNAPPTEFQKGMKLEVADIFTDDETNDHKTSIRKATVQDTWCRFLCISFDGWGVAHDKWISASSAEIYPVGWCALHRNPGAGDNNQLGLVQDGVERTATILPEGRYREIDPSTWNTKDLSDFFNDNNVDEVVPIQRQRQTTGRQFLEMNTAGMRSLARGNDILVRKLVGLKERIMAIAEQ